MKVISNDNIIFAFSPNNKPAATVKPKGKVKFVTKDCFGGRVRTAEDLVEDGYVNPCTGPLYIADAEPGDTLVVKIKEIKMDEYGLMMTGPNMGGFGHLVDTLEIKVMSIKEELIEFNDELKLPIEPMIGVIGTTPADEEIKTNMPGRHGGNMDVKHMKKGSILYLPVYVPGGLLAMGDLHAAMGDGETSDTGVEVAGEVTVEVDLIKGKQEIWPVLETSTKWYTIASAEDYESAVKLALEAMFEFLKSRVMLKTNDIVFLLGIAADIEICQIVNQLITVRASLDKDMIKSLNIKF